jgi:hypothetical protein
MRYLLFFFLVFSICKTFAQTKKEQIEILSKRVDSLINSTKIEKILLTQKLDSFEKQKNNKIIDLNNKINQLSLKIGEIENINQELAKQNINFEILLKQNDSLISILKNSPQKQIKDTVQSNTINGFSIVRLKEKEMNCSSKTKYHKTECSDMTFEYDWIHSYTNDEYICSQINQVIEESIFGNRFAKDSLFRDFLEMDYEYFEHQHFFGNVNYISSDFISITNYSTISGEGIPAVHGGIVNAFIFDLKKNEKINFSQIFKPNSEEKIRELILRHTPENGRGRIESQIEFIHYDRIFFSNRDEKGICFFVGQEYNSVAFTPIPICIPFDECASLLTDDFKVSF